MTRTGRCDRALLLAAVAAIGLVVTPLLHAEEHLQEAGEDSREVAELAEAWEAGSTNPLDGLAVALARGHDRPRGKGEGGDDHGRHHRHSHGPPGRGPHGAGALAHFGVALHDVAPPPAVPLPPASAIAVTAIASQLRAVPRYLVPQRAQGPPSRG